jgi:chemotaxis protein CheZ
MSDQPLENNVLYDELQNLLQLINQAKADVAAIRPDEIQTQHIPTATDELDAIVEATATATGAIMDACEQIEAIGAQAPETMQQALTEQVTSIYEACSFQDITGQRVTKVIKALKQIDEKIQKLVVAFGTMSSDQTPPTANVVTGDAALLNGPQLSGQGMDQDDIDKLLFGS